MLEYSKNISIVYIKYLYILGYISILNNIEGISNVALLLSLNDSNSFLGLAAMGHLRLRRTKLIMEYMESSAGKLRGTQHIAQIRDEVHSVIS